MPYERARFFLHKKNVISAIEMFQFRKVSIKTGNRIHMNTKINDMAINMVTFLEWKDFPHYGSFIKAISWSQGDSPDKGPKWGVLMSPFLLADSWCWVNSEVADDVRHCEAHVTSP